MLRIQQNHMDKKPTGITGTSYRGHASTLPSESSTDQSEIPSPTGSLPFELAFVRGTTTEFREHTSDQDDEDDAKKITGKSLSVSRSGRCKNRNQFRIKLPSEDTYIEVKPAVSGLPSQGNPASIAPTADVNERVELGASQPLEDNVREAKKESYKRRNKFFTQKKLPAMQESGVSIEKQSEMSQPLSPLSPTQPAHKKASSASSIGDKANSSSSTTDREKEKVLSGLQESVKLEERSAEEGITLRSDVGSGNDSPVNTSKGKKGSKNSSLESQSKAKNSPKVKTPAVPKQRTEKVNKKADRNSSVKFQLGDDGMCKLAIHNESASLGNVDSTDL